MEDKWKARWKKVKENYAAVLAIGTAFVTVIYAMLRFMMFLYWSGYFKALNIDINLMSLDYSGMILYAIFLCVVLLLLIYMCVEMCSIIRKMNARIKERGNNKLWNVIKCVMVDLLISVCCLLLGNIPIILILLVVSHINLTVSSFLGIFCVLYVTEIVIVFLETKKEKDYQVEGFVIAAIIFVPTVLALLYFNGANSMEQMKNIRVTAEEKYAVVYCDGERYILESIEFNGGNEAIIDTCNQKIIGVSDVEIISVPVERVKLK